MLLLISLHDAVSQGEIEALYQRFRSLDRGHKVVKQHQNVPKDVCEDRP